MHKRTTGIETKKTFGLLVYDRNELVRLITFIQTTNSSFRRYLLSLNVKFFVFKKKYEGNQS